MSQGWIETRIRACEEALEYLKRQILDLTQQLRAAAQAARTASTGLGGGGGGSSGSFWCLPSAAVGGATGTWPTLTGIGFTANVYGANGASLVLIKASAQCYNFMPAGLVSGKVVALVADGQGNYDSVTQSCA
jgi:hypothetical protein